MGYYVLDPIERKMVRKRIRLNHITNKILQVSRFVCCRRKKEKRFRLSRCFRYFSYPIFNSASPLMKSHRFTPS
ncbi:MAG: hypothetical protein LBV02_07410 [Bacteroidales bacterium]|nr:hypothetical protein [Bacteroidales bacterium]